MNELPPRLSISAMQKYEQCPQAYRYRYIDKPDVEIEPDSDQQRRGRAVHSALEAAYLAAVENKLVGSMSNVECEALEALDREWISEELDPSEKGEATDAVRRVLLERSVDHANVLGVEFEFDLMMTGDIHFVGYADLVERLDETTIEVNDWKVTARSKSPDDILGSFQLNTYGWAAQQIWPWAKTIHLTEIYPLLDEKVSVEMNQEHAKFAVSRFQADVEGLRSEKDWDAAPSVLCGWCNYREICPDAAEVTR